MLTEMLINFIHPNLATAGIKFTIHNDNYDANLEYFVNTFFSVVMLLRVYHLIVAYIVSSKFSSLRAQRVREMNGSNDASAFAVRSILADESFKSITILMLGCMMIGGFGLRIFERPLTEFSGYDFSSYGNSIWTVILTITTVGYGDYFISTIPGRVVGVITCVAGMVVISLIVGATMSALELDMSEQYSFDVMTRIAFK